MVTHLVLFDFRTPEDAAEAQRRLLSMVGRISGATSIEAGLDFTASPRSFQLGLVTRHPDRAALLAYQADPLHVEVAAFLKERSIRSAAVDFESTD